MSPFLERENVPEGQQKFVRIGKRIAFEPLWGLHDDIAQEYFPDLQIDTQSKKPLVDDAGYIGLEGRKDLIISGDSTTCKIKDSRQEARRETAKLAKEITGKPIMVLELD